VRAGRSLRVILHTEERQRAVAHALVRVVVQIHVRDFHITRRQRIRVHAEAMILRRNLHFLGEQVFHRMIRAVVPEFQFERAAAKGQTAELMPQTNPENWDASEQLPNILNSIANRFGIARTIGKKNAVRLERERSALGGESGRAACAR